MVAIFTGAATAGQPVTVFGNGEQTRDYIYVDDVVTAWLAAARSNATGAMNVSTGAQSSVRELATALGLRYELADARPGETDRSCLDPSCAERELDWRAAVSLSDGLQRTLRAAA